MANIIQFIERYPENKALYFISGDDTPGVEMTTSLLERIKHQPLGIDVVRTHADIVTSLSVIRGPGFAKTIIVRDLQPKSIDFVHRQIKNHPRGDVWVFQANVKDPRGTDYEPLWREIHEHKRGRIIECRGVPEKTTIRYLQSLGLSNSQAELVIRTAGDSTETVFNLMRLLWHVDLRDDDVLELIIRSTIDISENILEDPSVLARALKDDALRDTDLAKATYKIARAYATQTSSLRDSRSIASTFNIPIFMGIEVFDLARSLDRTKLLGILEALKTANIYRKEEGSGVWLAAALSILCS